MKLHFEVKVDSICPRQEIAEYLDGELSSDEELDLEFHFSDCKICSEELNSQKMVSTSLEIMLDEEKKDIPLPANFTKIVTANAESNMDGMRNPKERSRALFICAMLFLLVLFGVGLEGETVSFAFNRFADQFLAVGGFIWRLLYTLSLGVSAIFGSLFTKFVFSSTLSLGLVIVALVLASITLSRMVLRFNRS